MLGNSKYLIYMLGDLHLSSATPISRVDSYTENIFNKLEFVFREASSKLLSINESNEVYILLPGDLFHTASQPDSLKNKFISLVKKYSLEGRILAVYGNHDSIYYNSELNYKTSLGVMESSNTLNILGSKPLIIKKKDIVPTSHIAFWGLSLEEISSKKFLEYSFKSEAKFNILVAHAFLETPDRLSLPLEFVESTSLDAILLGHDHNQYPLNKLSNGTLVVRPGALSRATSSTESKNRKPSYCLLELGDSEITASMVEIPHLPSEDVYRYKSAEESAKVEKVSYEVIKTFITKLSSIGKENNPYKVLKSMDLSVEDYDSCVNYLNASGLKSNS